MGGTGLGLSIVKHICTLYNAGLMLESTLGVGTTITVSVPVANRRFAEYETDGNLDNFKTE
mgnify:CR=1 FL=1